MIHSSDSEQRYDHLDGMGQFDAAEIREMTGYETDGSNEDFTAEAIAARTGNVALSGYLQDQEPPRNEKGGLDHAAWAKANADPAQAETNRVGAATAQRTLSRTDKEQ